jgi:hypothetical protein
MIAVIMLSASINTPIYMPTDRSLAAMSPLLKGMAGTQKPLFGGNFGLGELIQTCARVAGTVVQIVPVPPQTAPRFPLVRANWAARQRSPARARATAGMPATPLAVTVADVLTWDRERGEPRWRAGSPQSRSGR